MKYNKNNTKIETCPNQNNIYFLLTKNTHHTHRDNSFLEGLKKRPNKDERQNKIKLESDISLSYL